MYGNYIIGTNKFAEMDKTRIDKSGNNKSEIPIYVYIDYYV